MSSRYIALTDAAVRDCRRLMERSVKVAEIEKLLSAQTGRKRTNSVTALLSLFALAAHYSDATKAHISRTVDIAEALTERQRAIIGLDAPYHPGQLYRLNAEIARRDLTCDENGVIPDHALPFTLNALATDIVTASIPEQLRPSNTYAIDGTDLRTWGNWHKARARRKANESHDAKEPLLKIADPDAEIGHRTPSQDEKDLFYGRMAHLATDVPEFGFQGDHVPLIRGVVLASNAEGVTSRAGLELIDEMRAITNVEHVIADRGYTFATTEKWARPLAERGIGQTLDLHPTQTGPQPGPKNLPGTQFIDGALFVTGLPRHLVRLERIPRFQGLEKHYARVAQFDERGQYAFRRVSENKDIWYGPAYAGRERVRCVNWPASMKKLDLPLTSCVPGQPCSCGTRKTVRDFDLRLAQRYVWGTTDWEADYGRRTFVETTNSYLKSQVGQITRSSIRLMGRAKVTLAFAILLAVVNMKIIDQRYDIGIGSTDIPDIPVPNPRRRKYRARYKNRPKPRTTTGPPKKRGDGSAIPAQMQPPPIASTTT